MSEPEKMSSWLFDEGRKIWWFGGVFRVEKCCFLWNWKFQLCFYETVPRTLSELMSFAKAFTWLYIRHFQPESDWKCICPLAPEQFFVEVLQKTKGHFKFSTNNLKNAKKFLLAEKYLVTHADPTIRVEYIKSDKIFQKVVKVCAGIPKNCQVVRNPRDSSLCSLSLQIMGKNELKNKYPCRPVSKDCLAGRIEAHRLQTGSWLGFKAVYETVVDSANPLVLEIKPQHGQSGQYLVSLEASVRKTNVSWEVRQGRSKMVVYGPGV